MRSVLASVALLGALLTAVAQPRVDDTRLARTSASILLFAPDGEQLRLVASGFEEVFADVLWSRAVLIFGERFGDERASDWNEWFRRTVEAVVVLDPRWRTPHMYGGALLRVLGDVEGSNAIFEHGSEHLPHDATFPFSRGMNAYLYEDDPETAAKWLEEASRRPNAPAWYAAGAAAMRHRAGASDAAIRYLREQIGTTDDDAVRAEATRQLGRIVHDRLVDTWEDACRAFRAENGRLLASPDELAARLGRALPENPRGDAWIVGADGVVRSAAAERERLRRARMGEWDLVRP